MLGNTSLLESDATLAWLGQFDPLDQQLAVKVLRSIRLVSRDAFSDGMRDLILSRANDGGLPVGLYVERELGHRKGIPHRLFKEHDRKVRRAYGAGPRPVQPMRSIDPEVGSEGILAQLVTDLCREHRTRLFSHPGPDQIRKHKIRRFILVTDFVGSGKRASSYLKAAWRVRSVRSWWSRRASHGLSFEVVAYAATAYGRQLVESHACHPVLHCAVGCPTIDTEFSAAVRAQVADVCSRYAPASQSSALGFGGIGALIAFAHGIPNNAPRILHARGPAWRPLFPARVTAGVRLGIGLEVDTLASVREQLLKLRENRLAESEWVARAPHRVQNQYLVMAALGKRPRSIEVLALRTGLTILEVGRALSLASKEGWIGVGNALTDRGRSELSAARRASPPAKLLPHAPKQPYYPQQLRAPSSSSS